MPSKYFAKTGTKNPGQNRAWRAFCLPSNPLSDAKVHEKEVTFAEQSFLATSKYDSQQERFLGWSLDLTDNWFNPLCPIRETPHNEADPYDEILGVFYDERMYRSNMQFALMQDAEEVLSSSLLTEAERKLVEIDLAWACYAGHPLPFYVSVLHSRYSLYDENEVNEFDF